ncbi:uncharacterized protein LOC132724833 [Ruditapes philippinarum]|uniref:uncharacterized protein LOC132724833 n=1 Tax=Ruditapes philippinarum TaxID=129788 RepID=UPI00295B83B1|nr:uncharacterized protein LOC132724833 [Ruditapes philippinarum]
MAEGDSSIPLKKKIKLAKLPDIGLEKIDGLRSALEALESSPRFCFCLLKIISSDAHLCTSFSRAKCETKKSYDKDDDVDETTKRSISNKEIYPFIEIFQNGGNILKKYLSDQSYIPNKHIEKLALEKLLSLLLEIEDLGEKMSYKKPEFKTCKNETSWTVRLAHHILSPLAVYQPYVIDDTSKNKCDICHCCKEPISGVYGDTSLGNINVWHGSLDILLGRRVGMKIHDDEIFEDHEGKPSTSSFEIKDGDSLVGDRQQIIAETIVFAFLQKKINPDLKHFLIPTIGMSKTDVLFYLYDTDHDVLLESPPFFIFENNREISYVTILALWLAINYPILGTGITTHIKNRSFTADFLTHLRNKKVETIYENEVQLGQLKGKVRVDPYYLPNDGGRWVVKKGGMPLKEAEKNV